MAFPLLRILIAAALIPACAWAETVADRRGAILNDRANLENDPRWIYNDFNQGFAKAKQTGKPLPVTLRRGTATLNVQLELAEGWRNRSDISRRVGTWSLRAMALGGLQLEDLTDAQRQQRGLEPDQLALLVKHAGEYGEHAAAKRAGFLKGDVLVEIDGARQRATESTWISRLLREHSMGETVPVSVLREGRRIDLKLPMQ